MAKKREDELSTLECKLLEIDKFIAEKACFGLKEEDIKECSECPLKEQCAEYVDIRLVKEEEALWSEEVNEELEVLEGIEKPKKTVDAREIDWGRVIVKIKKAKCSKMSEVLGILQDIGLESLVAEKSAQAVVKNMVKAGLLEIEGDSISWLK